MTAAPPIPGQPSNPMLDSEYLALTEWELRSLINQEDRAYMRAGDTNVKLMSEQFEPGRFRRYINLCRALRFKTRASKQNVHVKNNPASS